ncbi:MAG: zinc-dependent metalloprotease [Acidimicrobiales bacterium]
MSTSGPFGSTPGEPDPDDPFGGMGFLFQDLSRLFSGGGGSWDTAAQLAGSIATEGRPEVNVDPVDRLAIEQLARVAELQVQEVTGLNIDEPVRLEALNRTQWARRFLDDERPLLEELSDSIGIALQAQLGQVEDDLAEDPDALTGLAGLPGMSPEALIRQVMSMMGPMLLGMMAGSTAGHLAVRAMGHFELPLPRPEGEPLTMVLANVDSFAEEWSLPKDSIRLWVCLSDVAHAQILGIPHVRARITDLLGQYVSSFNSDPEDMERRMQELGVPDLLGVGEPDMAALQRLASDPDMLLGAMQSDQQRQVMPQLAALVAIIEGYVDHVLDTIGGRLLPDYNRVTEALRRRRVEAGPQTRFVERLFGLELSQATFDRGADFVDGVVERAGVDALASLWTSLDSLPTPADLDAPGLWLARLDIESTELTLDDATFEVPDFLDLPDED